MTTNAERRPAGNGPANNKADADAGTILEQVEVNGDGWWRSCARAALLELAGWGVEFTAATLTEQLGVDDPDHPARWGALFAAAHRAGVIVPVGFTTSTRRSRHGGVCRVWRGVPEAVARGWDA